MKRILEISVWSILILGTLVLSGFINSHRQSENCQEVIITIEDENLVGFIDEGDVVEILNKEFNTPISQKINEIDAHAIELRLNRHEAVESAEVYISIDGKLYISLYQRRPILRVFAQNTSFYIDDNATIMPVFQKFTAHVPVATGDINLDLDIHDSLLNEEQYNLSDTSLPRLYSDLWKLAHYIDEKPFWRAQIEQLYVDNVSEIELIPRVGNHTIVLGEVQDLDEKFTKLMNFYKHGLTKTGWNEYRTINLKYKNQIVCTKRY